MRLFLAYMTETITLLPHKKINYYGSKRRKQPFLIAFEWKSSISYKRACVNITCSISARNFSLLFGNLYFLHFQPNKEKRTWTAHRHHNPAFNSPSSECDLQSQRYSTVILDLPKFSKLREQQNPHQHKN